VKKIKIRAIVKGMKGSVGDTRVSGGLSNWG